MNTTQGLIQRGWTPITHSVIKRRHIRKFVSQPVFLFVCFNSAIMYQWKPLHPWDLHVIHFWNPQEGRDFSGPFPYGIWEFTSLVFQCWLDGGKLFKVLLEKSSHEKLNTLVSEGSKQGRGRKLSQPGVCPEITRNWFPSPARVNCKGWVWWCIWVTPMPGRQQRA